MWVNFESRSFLLHGIIVSFNFEVRIAWPSQIFSLDVLKWFSEFRENFSLTNGRGKQVQNRNNFIFISSGKIRSVQTCHNGELIWKKMSEWSAHFWIVNCVYRCHGHVNETFENFVQNTTIRILQILFLVLFLPHDNTYLKSFRQRHIFNSILPFSDDFYNARNYE